MAFGELATLPRRRETRLGKVCEICLTSPERCGPASSSARRSRPSVLRETPQGASQGIVGGRGSSSVVPAGHAATHRSYGRLRDFYPHELTKPPKTHSIAGPTAEKGAWSMTPIAVPLELLLIFIYSAFFDTINSSFYSIFSIFSEFFNFCSRFFGSPFFFYFFVTG